MAWSAIVNRVSSYEISVGSGEPVRVKDFLEVRSVIAEAVTRLMAIDPEGVAQGAGSLNLAWDSGAVKHSLTAHGTWSTPLTVDGEEIVLRIVRKRW
jgi:hypothetical protein